MRLYFPIRSRNLFARIFQETSKKTGIKIASQTLRSVFAREMVCLNGDERDL